MTDLYQVLRNPSIENLHEYDIEYFDELAREYPDQYRNIISYINDCYNYQSPYHITEKDWGVFLKERGKANNLDESIANPIYVNEIPVVVYATQDYIHHQKQKVFATKIAKENLRIGLLLLIQTPGTPLSEKKIANEMITDLDIELQKINERLKQDQKVFGGFKGYEAIAKIKNSNRINIGDD